MSAVKQVIVVRRDLGMRRGKEQAMVAHGAMEFIRQRLYDSYDGPPHLGDSGKLRLDVTPAELQWLGDEHRKVVCQIPTEEELRELYTKAKALGLEAHLIVDMGATEFHGVATTTCLAIGPDYAEKIDPLTGGLQLY